MMEYDEEIYKILDKNANLGFEELLKYDQLVGKLNEKTINRLRFTQAQIVLSIIQLMKAMKMTEPAASQKIATYFDTRGLDSTIGSIIKEKIKYDKETYKLLDTKATHGFEALSKYDKLIEEINEKYKQKIRFIQGDQALLVVTIVHLMPELGLPEATVAQQVLDYFDTKGWL